MKKRILSALLTLVTALTFIRVNAPAHAALPEVDWLVTEDTVYDSIDIYMDNRSVWQSEAFGVGADERYGLIDLDADGIPELFMTSNYGTGNESENKFYRIGMDKKSVYMIKNVPSEVESYDLVQHLSIYRDKMTGDLMYYCENTGREGWEYNYQWYGFMFLQNDAIAVRSLWGVEHTIEYVEDIEDYIDTYTYYKFTDNDTRENLPDESAFEKYQEDYLKQYDLIAERVPYVTLDEMNEADDETQRAYLHEMYDELYQSLGLLTTIPVAGGNENNDDGPCKDGHTWDEGKVIYAPTSDEVGSRRYTCTVCGEIKYEDIPIIGMVYAVTADACGGKPERTSLATDRNGKLSDLPEPTRDGYTFNGWFTELKGGDAVTTDTVFTDDTTIYAQWTKDKTNAGSDSTVIILAVVAGAILIAAAVTVTVVLIKRKGRAA